MKSFFLTIITLILLSPQILQAQKVDKKKNGTKDVVEKKNLIFSKQKSAFQIGVFGGATTLMGDVKPTFLSGGKPALPGHNFGLFVSKSWTYLFSTRLRYSTMVMFTNNAVASTLTSNQYRYLEERSSGLNGFHPGSLFFHNSRTQGHDLSLDFMFSLGNINFNKKRSSVVFKIFPTIGMFMYQTFYDHLDGNGDAYDYLTVDNLNTQESNSSKDILKELAGMRDGIYETRAEEHTVGDEKKFLNYNPRLIYGLGAGVAFRLTKFMSLDLEMRQLLTRDDLIDGVQWQEPEGNNFVSRNQTRNFDSYNQATIGLTFSIMGKEMAESMNMDNPLAGEDAFSKKAEEKKDTKTDSTNLYLNEKVDNLEGQVDDLEVLIKMLGKSMEKENEERAKLEAEKNKLIEEAKKIEAANGEQFQEKQPQGVNDLEDNSYKLRNGDYIFVSDLEGEVHAAYYLVLESFRIKSNGTKAQRKWDNKGVNTVILMDAKSSLYRVIVDYTESHTEALDMLDKYRKKLDNDIWLIKQK